MTQRMEPFPKKTTCAAAPRLITTSAYGHAEVARRGQAGLLPWLAEAGAEGVEIRRELLPEAFENFTDLGRACTQYGLAVVYSAADTLWQDTAPSASIAERLSEAAALGAIAVKFSLGQFSSGDAPAWQRLATVLAASPVPLVMVENDQTPEGGTLAPLTDFLNAAQRADCPLCMTFDIGNWRWTNSDVGEAAQRLGRHVRYVHCKGIDIRDGRPHASVPSDAELADWQALMAHFPSGVPRAIEYPLPAPDRVSDTRHQLARLATL